MAKDRPEWLDVWEFRRWLDVKPSVGRAGSHDDCPVARYVREVVGPGPIVSVGPSGVTVGEATYFSSWVSLFVRKVDARGGDISAAVALDILDGI